MPRFDTAELPPWYSCGASFRTRARAARSFISLEMSESRFSSAWRTTGVIRPPGIDTATPTSACLWRSMPPSVQVTLASGTRISDIASALITMSLTDTFQAGFLSLSIGAAALMSARSASSASISVSIVR